MSVEQVVAIQEYRWRKVALLALLGFVLYSLFTPKRTFIKHSKSIGSNGQGDIVVSADRNPIRFLNNPIRKVGQHWYWGSRGPFATRQKAVEIARAAYASGYQGRNPYPITCAHCGAILYGASLTPIKCPRCGKPWKEVEPKKNVAYGRGSPLMPTMVLTKGSLTCTACGKAIISKYCIYHPIENKYYHGDCFQAARQKNPAQNYQQAKKELQSLGIHVKEVSKKQLCDYRGMNSLAASRMGRKLPSNTIQVLKSDSVSKKLETLKHEASELAGMRKGMNYWGAHRRALLAEISPRTPAELLKTNPTKTYFCLKCNQWHKIRSAIGRKHRVHADPMSFGDYEDLRGSTTRR